MSSDAVLEVEDHVSPEELAVEKVDHCSIELSWNTEEEDRSGPPDEWTRFAVEQMDPKTNTFFTVYIGHSNHHIVENLLPSMSYQFRLRITKPNGECSLTSAVSASTSSESTTRLWLGRSLLHLKAASSVLCTSQMKPSFSDSDEPPNGKQLHQAVNRNDEEELSRVLESGIMNLNIYDKLGNTALMVAAQKGFSRMVHKLIQHGADISMKNVSGKDCLMLACFAGHLDIVKHLRIFGATWQSQDVSGCTPLHWAVDGGHLPVVAFMIEDGCEVDVRDTVSEWTPLMRVSAMSGNAAVASLLIQAGADVNVRDKDGKTPLMVAVLNNHEELVKLLLDSGADQHVTNMYGSSITEMAEAFGKQDIIKLLENVPKQD
ncbi:fibronectin type 3 and ankyrin repeat domains 1 protein [Clarias gariepinus]|uniref:fibronectin type 3 and ankyrin repeat domains 1 protein n=1 Tax=Clarias gariepinus TaxID=13013 RepID=UPI00234C2794|nr:fibronectin type 3 and ankyrin repeat domains 1 protein [Clarias gariepinus]